MQERKSRNTSSRFSVLVALGLLVLLAVVGVSTVSGATRPVSGAVAPAIQITPNSGKYGTVTVVTGQGFAPREQVAIYKQTRAFFAYETDASGSFVGAPHPLLGPGPLSGIITITGIGRTSGLKATTVFTVTP